MYWFESRDKDDRNLLTRLAQMHRLEHQHPIAPRERPCNKNGFANCAYCKKHFSEDFNGTLCILECNSADFEEELSLLSLLMALSGLTREALEADDESKDILALHPELDDSAYWDMRPVYKLLLDAIDTDEGWLRFIMAALWACCDYAQIRSKMEESQQLQARCVAALDVAIDSLKAFSHSIEELQWLRVVRPTDFSLGADIAETIRKAELLSSDLDFLEDRHIGLHVVAALSKQSRNQKTAYLRAFAGLLTTVDGFAGHAIPLNTNVLNAMAIVASIVCDEDISYDYVRKTLEDFRGL